MRGTSIRDDPRSVEPSASSYAVFQPFQVPLLHSSSYRYCGLRDADGNIDTTVLIRRVLNTIKEIHLLSRMEIWFGIASLKDFLGHDAGAALVSPETVGPLLNTLSTGQFIVLSMFSDLLVNIERQSLFLCDEPESYLHPTLLSTFMRTMHRVLELFDSYAVIATHSPIVVQEIPSRYVRVFEREGTVPMQLPLARESFAENLTELVDHVFRMNEDDKNSRTIIRDLASSYSAAMIEAMFEGKLSLSARLLLKSLRTRKG